MGSTSEFTKGPVHINGIEGFWGLAKVRLTQFKGLPKHTFHLHLKETEWRYNHRHADKYKCLLQYLPVDAASRPLAPEHNNPKARADAGPAARGIHS